MSDEQSAAPSEAAEEVVQSQETETPEAAESTEGQAETPPAEGEGEQPGPEEKSPAAKRRERRKAHEAELRARADEAEAKVQRAKERQDRIAQEAANNSQPPKEADFADYNEFLIASGAYHANQTLTERESRNAEHELTEAEQERQAAESEREALAVASFASQVDEARTIYADFDKVAFTAPINEDLAGLIRMSDHGADLAYHLGQHRDVAARLSKEIGRDRFSVAMELGRIEATLSTPKPALVSETPEPISTVKPKASAGSVDPTKMTNAEYRAARAAGKI